MVSRWGYADNWDAFMKKIHAYSPKKTATFYEECRRESGRIGMIVELSLEWRTQQSGERAVNQRAERSRALVEAVRWIRVERELNPYVDVRTRALMPERRIHHQSHPERIRNVDGASRFFRQMDQGTWRQHSIAQIVERTYRLSPQAWAAAHPYGPPPSAAQLRALQETLLRCRPRAIRPRDKFVVSPERATALALHLLSRIT